jgi:hypothetical protein
MKLMELYNTYLGPAVTNTLNLGDPSFRWKDFYMIGSMSGANFVTGTHMLALSMRSVAFVSTISTTLSSRTVAFVSSIANVGTATVTVSNVTSENVTSLRFVRSVGSSLSLSNSANAYLNVNILTHNAASMISGDVYFFTSSNRVYLGINSQSTTYFIAMDT